MSSPIKDRIAELSVQSLWHYVYVESEAVAERARYLAPLCKDEEDRCTAHFMLAYHLARRAPVEQANAAISALEAQVPIHRDTWRWLFEDARAYLLMRLGRPVQARALLAPHLRPEVLALRSSQHRCVTFNILGHLEARAGELEAGLRHRYLHLHAAQRAQLDFEEAVAWTNIAESHASLFNLDDAVSAQARAFEMWCELLRPQVRAVAAANLMSLHCLRKDAAAAAAVLSRWQAQPGSVPSDELQLYAGDIALTLLNNNQLDEAGALLSQGFKGADHLPMREARWVLASAEWLLRIGEAARSREVTERYLEACQSEPLVSGPDRVWILEVLARACEAQGDLAAALRATRIAHHMSLPLLGSSARAHVLGLRWSAEEPATDVVGTDALRLAMIDRAIDAEVFAPESLEPRPVAAALDVARISHDMRSPLNGVLGLTSMLLTSDLDERQRKLAALTKSSAESLLVMVNDIVDLARSEQGRLTVQFAPVNLWGMAQELVEIFRLQLLNRPVGLTLHIDPDVPEWIDSDGDKLRRVLHNFLSNATKFTRRGEIGVVIETEAAWPRAIRLEVRDTGIGIAHAEHHRVFGEFYQARTGGVQPGASSGLGLAVSKRLIEALGGEVGFNSVEGQGSMFWLRHPINRTPACAAAATC